MTRWIVSFGPLSENSAKMAQPLSEIELAEEDLNPASTNLRPKK